MTTSARPLTDFVGPMRGLVAGAFSAGKRSVRWTDLKAALEQKDEQRTLELLSPAVEATEAKLQRGLAPLLKATLGHGGHAAAEQLNARLRAMWEDPKTGIDDHGRGPKDADKVRAARESHKPATAQKQRLAEANQHTVAAMVGGSVIPGNEPFDVKVGKHRLEVKTIVEGSDKITMHGSSLDRKLKDAKKSGSTAHTVVLDDRKIFGAKGYSGHRIYYRKGLGSFRLHTLTKVKSSKHLQDLLKEKN